VAEGKQTKFAMSGLLSFAYIGQGCRDSQGKRIKKTTLRVVMRLQLRGMCRLHRQGLYEGVSRGRGRSRGVADIDVQDLTQRRNRNGRYGGE